MWIALTQGLVAGIIALFGVVYTQRRANSRDDERWKRDREHQEMLWRREDAFRSYEHRRESYLEFLAAAQRVSDELQSKEDRLGPDFDLGIFEPLQEMVLKVKVFGSSEAAAHAMDLGVALVDRAAGSGHPVQILHSRAAFIREVRRDLLVTD